MPFTRSPARRHAWSRYGAAALGASAVMLATWAPSTSMPSRALVEPIVSGDVTQTVEAPHGSVRFAFALPPTTSLLPHRLAPVDLASRSGKPSSASLGFADVSRAQGSAVRPTAQAARHGLSTRILQRLIAKCSPEVNAQTQSALVMVESGADAWAIHDDNDDSKYSPDSREDAARIVGILIARDHAVYGSGDRGVDVGLAQINSANFGTLAVDADQMLDPCENLEASDTILAAAYRAQRGRDFGGPVAEQHALERALQVYNSGKSSGDERYVAAVRSSFDRLAGRAEEVDGPADTSRATPPVAISKPAVVQRVFGLKATSERSAEFVHVDAVDATAPATMSTASPAARAATTAESAADGDVFR